jgi:hypothetical protein
MRLFQVKSVGKVSLGERDRKARQRARIEAAGTSGEGVESRDDAHIRPAVGLNRRDRAPWRKVYETQAAEPITPVDLSGARRR